MKRRVASAFQHTLFSARLMACDTVPLQGNAAG
jgi:hypothetical protein